MSLTYFLLLVLLLHITLSEGLPVICSRAVQRRVRVQALSEVSDTVVGTTTEAATVDYSAFNPGADIWIGSIVAVIPIVWASFEFWSRIRTQQECAVCKGSGLVYATKSGNQLTRPRKCWNCGGFLPWLGWKRFFLTSLFDVGNGGALRRPDPNYQQNNQEWVNSRAADTATATDTDTVTVTASVTEEQIE